MLKVVWGRIEDRRLQGTEYGRAAHDDDAWLVRHLQNTTALLKEAQETVCSKLCPNEWYDSTGRPPHAPLCSKITEELQAIGTME